MLFRQICCELVSFSPEQIHVAAHIKCVAEQVNRGDRKLHADVALLALTAVVFLDGLRPTG